MTKLLKNSHMILAVLAAWTIESGAWAQMQPSAVDWSSYKHAGDDAFAANNYGVAERAYLPALKEAEKFGAADVRLADTLSCLGVLYETRGQFAKAEPYFERAVRAYEKALGPEHPKLVAEVGRLAKFYLCHGSTQKGDKLCNLLLKFADRKVKDQQALTDSLGKVAVYYDKSKGYTEARNILHSLQEETKRTNANENLELATTLDTLGHLFESRGDFDIAEKMYKNALNFREHSLAPDHLALAYSCENLASLYQVQGKSEQARPYFKRSLQITEKTLQPGRPEVYKRLDSLAQAHIGAGQNAEAESLYKRALQLMEKTPERGDIGSASFALGTLYIKEQRYSAAEPLMKRALAIAESVNGPQHAALVPILDSYAGVLDKLGKSDQANKERARASAIRGRQSDQASTGGNL